MGVELTLAMKQEWGLVRVLRSMRAGFGPVVKEGEGGL